jgi:hypothetical protein
MHGQRTTARRHVVDEQPLPVGVGCAIRRVTEAFEVAWVLPRPGWTASFVCQQAPECLSSCQLQRRFLKTSYVRSVSIPRHS